MKVRLIEGEPASLMSGPFLRLDLSTHDAVVVVKDKKQTHRLARVLLDVVLEEPPAADKEPAKE